MSFFRASVCIFAALSSYSGWAQTFDPVDDDDPSEEVIAENLVKPDLMIVIGDSTSAGFIANTGLGRHLRLEEIVISLLMRIGVLGRPEDKVSEEQSGEETLSSLDLRVRLAQLLNHKRHYSWASGTRIDSNYLRLERYLYERDPDSSLAVRNYAITGGTSENLDLEARHVMNEWNSGVYHSIKLMTFMIGSNNLCNEPLSGHISSADMKKHLIRFFDQISTISQDEPIRILVSSIPRIPDLAIPRIFDHVTMGQLTCREMAQITHFCDPLLDWTTEEEHQERIQRVAEKNEVLKTTIQEIAAIHKNLDFFLSDQIERAEINSDDLAVDCFHPNILGQQMLSNLMWARQPWYK